MMDYHTLGKTGLTVSKLGFGCAPLGNEYGGVSEDEGIQAVQAAIEQGITLFDTSPYYGRTLSETRLGKALMGRRQEIVLATKGGRFDLEAETGFDFSYNSIVSMCDASLRRLQTDYIDIYQLHDVEFGRYEQVANEAIPALFDLKAAGKVRFVGVTGYPLPTLLKYISQFDLDLTLSYCHFNLQNQMMHKELLPTVRAKGMGLMNASVTGMGLLTDQGPQPWHPASDQIKHVTSKAAAFCRERGASLAQLAIQFALQYDKADVTLLGTRNRSELRESLSLLNAELDLELLHSVQEILQPVVNMGWPSGI